MDADVLAANVAFYDVFRRGDVGGMEAVWARRAEVACAHPGWAPLHGRDAVLASWRDILTSGPPPVRCGDARVYRAGDGGAVVICEERLPGVTLLATNVYVREDGAWRMVHHHAGMIAEADAPGPPSSLN